MSKFTASAALLSLELIIILISFFGSFVIVAWIVRRTFFLKKENLDFKVFEYFTRFVSDGTTRFMQFITIFGSHNFLVPANLALIAYFLFIRKHKWYSIKIPAVAITSLVLMFTLKTFFNRQRPLVPLLEQVGGLSFPSGHAFMSFSFFGLLIYLAYKYVDRKWLKWSMILFLLVFIFLIGISRIYLKVHYASDVMAGFSLGFMWLVMSIWILNKFEKKSIKKVIVPVVQIEEPVNELTPKN
ncbi:MAG: phosphatase PAP2 family protein [Chitinophagaceae bacterium]|nr:phosphatase PAP2 family protein [Chitinophagaceae bacterium]